MRNTWADWRKKTDNRADNSLRTTHRSHNKHDNKTRFIQGSTKALVIESLTGKNRILSVACSGHLHARGQEWSPFLFKTYQPELTSDMSWMCLQMISLVALLTI